MSSPLSPPPSDPSQNGGNGGSKRPTPPSLNVPRDFVSGDDNCHSCTGLLYFSNEMRKRKELPLCIGRRSTLNKKISLDKLEVLDKQSSKPDLGWYLCIGYSQWSGRMERMGFVPICITGSEIHVGKKVVPQKRKEEGAPDNQDYVPRDGKGEGETSKSQQKPNPQLYGQLQNFQTTNIVFSSAALLEKVNKMMTREGSDEAKETAEWWRRAMVKSSKRQYESSKEFISKTFERFPEKLNTSFNNLVTSTSKTASAIHRMIKTYINNNNGGNWGKP